MAVLQIDGIEIGEIDDRLADEMKALRKERGLGRVPGPIQVAYPERPPAKLPLRRDFLVQFVYD